MTEFRVHNCYDETLVIQLASLYQEWQNIGKPIKAEGAQFFESRATGAIRLISRKGTTVSGVYGFTSDLGLTDIFFSQRGQVSSESCSPDPSVERLSEVTIYNCLNDDIVLLLETRSGRLISTHLKIRSNDVQTINLAIGVMVAFRINDGNNTITDGLQITGQEDDISAVETDGMIDIQIGSCSRTRSSGSTIARNLSIDLTTTDFAKSSANSIVIANDPRSFLNLPVNTTGVGILETISIFVTNDVESDPPVNAVTTNGEIVTLCSNMTANCIGENILIISNPTFEFKATTAIKIEYPDINSNAFIYSNIAVPNGSVLTWGVNSVITSTAPAGIPMNTIDMVIELRISNQSSSTVTMVVQGYNMKANRVIEDSVPPLNDGKHIIYNIWVGTPFGFLEQGTRNLIGGAVIQNLSQGYVFEVDILTNSITVQQPTLIPTNPGSGGGTGAGSPPSSPLTTSVKITDCSNRDATVNETTGTKDIGTLTSSDNQFQPIPVTVTATIGAKIYLSNLLSGKTISKKSGKITDTTDQLYFVQSNNGVNSVNSQSCSIGIIDVYVSNCLSTGQYFNYSPGGSFQPIKVNKNSTTTNVLSVSHDTEFYVTDKYGTQLSAERFDLISISNINTLSSVTLLIQESYVINNAAMCLTPTPPPIITNNLIVESDQSGTVQMLNSSGNYVDVSGSNMVGNGMTAILTPSNVETLSVNVNNILQNPFIYSNVSVPDNATINFTSNNTVTSIDPNTMQESSLVITVLLYNCNGGDITIYSTYIVNLSENVPQPATTNLVISDSTSIVVNVYESTVLSFQDSQGHYIGKSQTMTTKNGNSQNLYITSSKVSTDPTSCGIPSTTITPSTGVMPVNNGNDGDDGNNSQDTSGGVNLGLIIGIVIAVIAVIGIILLILLFTRQGEDDKKKQEIELEMAEGKRKAEIEKDDLNKLK